MTEMCDNEYKEYVQVGDGKYEVYVRDDNGDKIFFKEYCGCVDVLTLQQAVDRSIADARENLEPGTVFEIRRKVREADSEYIGRLPAEEREFVDGVAWYYVPENKYYMEQATPKEPLVDYGVEGELRANGAYLLLARLKA